MNMEKEEAAEGAKQSSSQNQHQMEISNQDEKAKEEEELEAETETPSATALRNSLVVKMIIGHLNRSSLLKSRGINKLWRELCTELLSRSRDEEEDALRIQFRYCEGTGAYIKDFDGILRGEIRTLESFNEFLRQIDLDNRGRSSSSFPCTNFKFKDLVLSRPEVQDFFRIQGPKIKGLRLGFNWRERGAVTPESLMDLLMKKAPNVECLSFSVIPLDRDSALLNHRQILNVNNSLPFLLGKLRCLRFSQQVYDNKAHFLLVKEIALASPQLKNVFVLGFLWSDQLDFDYLTSISKSNLITWVELNPNAKNMEVLTKFVQSQPRLTNLSLSLEFVDSRSALRADRSISFEDFVPLASALLESSKESLEIFAMPEGKRIAQFLTRGKLPILKNVTFVDLYCREGRRRRRSGWDIPAEKFKEIFPNVRKLGLGGDHGLDGGLFEFPPLEGGQGQGQGPVLAEKDKMYQITELSLRSKFTREFLNKIPLVFCNLVELWIKNNDLIPILPLIWNYTSLRLKVLGLDISISANLMRNTLAPDFRDPTPIFPGLDSAFTGFPEETCVQLLSTHPKILDEEIVKEIRINSSILDLKYLEELRITFDIFADDELPENVLTVVSGAYAFQRMQLEQQFQVHIETKLRPPYDQNMAKLMAKKQRPEGILKPLLPYTKMTFTIDKS